MDDSTIATATSGETLSFVKVNGGNSLGLSILPKHDVIGLDATVKDAMNGGTEVKACTTQICVSMRAAELPDNEDERAPVDIVVALDVSGSMHSRKLKQCKETLNLLLRELMPQDRFGLISYGSDARIDFPTKRMTPENKDTAIKVIRGLRNRGHTNISAAIGLAAQEMRSIEAPNAVRSIFLLTDGIANRGITQPEDLVELTRNCLTKEEFKTDDGEAFVQETQKSFGEFSFVGSMFSGEADEDTKPAPQPSTTQHEVPKGPPISFHTFGYGTDHNAGLLRKMANATEGGSYYFVEDDNNVGSAFGSALGGVLSVVAQNVVVTVQVPPEANELGVKIIKIYHDQAIQRENGSYTVTVGDFYAEETRDLLLEVQLAVPTKPTEHAIPHVTASLSYTDTLEKRLSKHPSVLASIKRPAGTTLSKENEHVAAQWLRSYAAQQMAQAERFATQRDYTQARGSITGVAQMYKSMSPDLQLQSSPLFCNVQDTLRDLKDEASYSRIGSKTLNRSVQQHCQQRAYAPADDASASSSSVYPMSRKRASYAAQLSPRPSTQPFQGRDVTHDHHRGLDPMSGDKEQEKPCQAPHSL